jgi:S1-C subfamily serine protease
VTTASPGFNPFPGLRAFEWDEAHLFFGRDGQSDELLRRLARTRFVAVVGTSGSGKSSLVRAGLVPALVSGFMTRAGSAWRLAVFRPGDAPIDALADALVTPGVLGESGLDQAVQRAIVGAALRRSPLGLVEVVRQARLEPGENLLLVVDQFEEIFRFRGAAGNASAKDESAAFVKLILEAIRQADLPIYTVLTMRSDFLGDCAQFRDLPEALNAGQYLVPRMTRDERGAAITGPVTVGHGEISPRLVQRLLNDVGDDPDQLPILQHALMRTWDHWDRHAEDGRAIDLEDYEAIGGMAEALSQHADEAFDELADDDARRLAARVFKALTTRGPNAQGVRRPMSLARLAEVTGAPVSRVAAVIERFRAPGRSLLMPPLPTPLDESVVVDVSHESLIRQWGRLRAWVDEETDSRAMYLRIVDSAQRSLAGRGGLWRDPDLASALEWKGSNEPNAAWASLYDAGFEPAMRFLDDSRAAVAAERRERRIVYGVVGVCVLAVVVALVGLGIEWLSRRASEKQRAIAIEQREKVTEALRTAEAEREKVRRLLEETRKQTEIAQTQKQLADKRLADVKRAQDAANQASEAVGVAQKVIGDLSLEHRPSVVKLATSAAPTKYFGTAFFVSSAGWLVTTGQVAQQVSAGSALLQRATGTLGSARVVRIDRSQNLALLIASPGAVRCLALDGSPVKLGTAVIALGMSAGQGWSPTSGTVTGLDRSLQNVARMPGGTGDLIEVAMKTEPGFFGAPVVDVAVQRVIGLVAYDGQDGRTSYLIPASRIRAVFAGELATAPCSPAK